LGKRGSEADELLENHSLQVKNLLVIYPHWPPSNLAGVHRPRLVANYLQEFGWNPIILTVHPDYYEEEPDWDLLKTIKSSIEVHHVAAKQLTGRPYLVGDLGLRAWSQLKKRALEIIKSQQVDFIWIPIPSFYMAVLGRVLHNKTGVPYGIDYIDPWVRDISNRKDWRSVLSLKMAQWLEPYAVRKASLLSGVSPAYYLPVIARNKSIKDIAHIAFPYGFDPNDHAIKLDGISYPWNSTNKITYPLVYAGAFLPNSRLFIEVLFKAVARLDKNGNWPAGAKFYFLGTGAYPGKQISQYAEEAGVAELVYESRNRYPFLHILNFLTNAHAVMVIGSTEKHYTASKTFQSILSTRPIFAMLHQESTALEILQKSMAAAYTVEYQEQMSKDQLIDKVYEKLLPILQANVAWSVNPQALAPYSSRENAKLLAATLDQLLI
jgi:hypothetical protein